MQTGRKVMRLSQASCDACMKPPPAPQECPLQTSNYPNDRRHRALATTPEQQAYSAPLRPQAAPSLACLPCGHSGGRRSRRRSAAKQPDERQKLAGGCVQNRHTGRGLHPGNRTSAEVARRRRACIRHARGAVRKCISVKCISYSTSRGRGPPGSLPPAQSSTACTPVGAQGARGPTFAQSAMMLFQ